MEVLVGCSDDADVYLDLAGAPHTMDILIL